MLLELAGEILKEMFLSIDEIRNDTYYVNITIIRVEFQDVTTEHQDPSHIVVHLFPADSLFSLRNVCAPFLYHHSQELEGLLFGEFALSLLVEVVVEEDLLKLLALGLAALHGDLEFLPRLEGVGEGLPAEGETVEEVGDHCLVGSQREHQQKYYKPV